MAESLNIEIRKKIGKNFKRKLLLRGNPSLREIDAITGKDHSWIAKFEKGEINFTIDSLINLLIAFKIQPKEIFDFIIEFKGEDLDD
jgi:transcriptional regulator with XRE-family HTH domain